MLDSGATLPQIFKAHRTSNPTRRMLFSVRASFWSRCPISDRTSRRERRDSHPHFEGDYVFEPRSFKRCERYSCSPLIAGVALKARASLSRVPAKRRPLYSRTLPLLCIYRAMLQSHRDPWLNPRNDFAIVAIPIQRRTSFRISEPPVLLKR